MVHQRNYGGFLVEIRWVSGGNPPGFWWKSAGFLVEIRRVSGGNPPGFWWKSAGFLLEIRRNSFRFPGKSQKYSGVFP